MPIGSFAEDDSASKTCLLHINALNQANEAGTNAVIPIMGSMFLQNFVVNVTNDYSGIEKEALMTLNVSSQFAATNANINNDIPVQNTTVSSTFGYIPAI